MRVIVEELNMDKEMVREILTSLDMKKVCAKMVKRICPVFSRKTNNTNG
jgi:hypothetical protein